MSKPNKKLLVEQHNREYVRKQQEGLAYEIMDMEGLRPRDNTYRVRKRLRSRHKLVSLMAIASILNG